MTRQPNCKVVLLGKESTGKSCLVRRFTDDNFDHSGFAPTVGTSYAAKKVTTSCGEIVISLWDTAGQEKFDSLTRQYYHGASAALICIDLTDVISFSKAQFWAKELRKNEPDCSCYIVVTKTDLLEEPKRALPVPAVKAVPQLLSLQHSVSRAPSSGEACDAREASEATLASQDTLSSAGALCKGYKSGETPTSILDRRFSSDTSERGTSTDGLGSSWQSGSTSRPSFSSASKKKEVADSQVKALAQSMGARIVRTSSATGEGVAELFLGIAEDLAPSISRALVSEQSFQPDAPRPDLQSLSEGAEVQGTGPCQERRMKSCKQGSPCCI